MSWILDEFQEAPELDKPPAEERLPLADPAERRSSTCGLAAVVVLVRSLVRRRVTAAVVRVAGPPFQLDEHRE